MSQVRAYLKYLSIYLLGDLEKFHKLCEEAELEEKQSQRPYITTTMNVNSPEFIQGTFENRQVISIHRSTIPHTATLFATIDILGFLLNFEADEVFKNNTKNTTYFFEYVKNTFPLTPKEIEVLIKVFRNGLAHTYFPKLGMEISYHSTNPKNKMFFKNENSNSIVLNVNHLEEIVRATICKIIEDNSLDEKLDKRYGIIVNAYERECTGTIQDLLNLL